ncbi:MAG TPA: GYD domain-containing protein [Vicinamibacterales bacterium]
MPKYLYQVSYTQDGYKGLLKDGGTKRRQTVKALVEGLGGKLEVFEFAFGADDAVLVMDLPDHVTASAIALAVNASGGATGKLTVLVSPEDVDRAQALRVGYTPPGR